MQLLSFRVFSRAVATAGYSATATRCEGFNLNPSFVMKALLASLATHLFRPRSNDDGATTGRGRREWWPIALFKRQ